MAGRRGEGRVCARRVLIALAVRRTELARLQQERCQIVREGACSIRMLRNTAVVAAFCVLSAAYAAATDAGSTPNVTTRRYAAINQRCCTFSQP